MNRNPLWKNILLLVVLLVGLLYALPNIFDQDPSIQISASRRAEVTEQTITQIGDALQSAGIEYKAVEKEGERLLVRFRDSESQLLGNDVIAAELGGDYVQALTLSPDIPAWLSALGGEPMYLGLDLRGGIHVLIDVDMETAERQALETYTGNIRTQLRKEKLRYVKVGQSADAVEVRFHDMTVRDKAREVIEKNFPDLKTDTTDAADSFSVLAQMKRTKLKELRKAAISQNITTLRNRVNALGVSEPVIQQQGERRIVVQLPGAQDPARLKEVLGATATLEYRLEDTEHSVEDALAGKVPAGSKLYKTRKGQHILLKKRIIVTGNQITDAALGFDQRTGGPAVIVNLDTAGGARMRRVTADNVGKPMAVVFIETRHETRKVGDELVKKKVLVEEVISVATIQEPFGRRFQTTGLDDHEEARNLALLLRAGALAAPIEIVEERTIGPSLGADNIRQGFQSVVIGLALVMIFMAVYYRVFGRARLATRPNAR
jgi:preprotein translocase subunit SecD